MKNQIERLVVLPFTAGCISSSSVAVCVQHGTKRTEDINSSQIVRRSPEIPWDPKEKERIPITSSENTMRSSLRFLALSKPNVSTGFQKLTKSIRSLSQSLVFKDEIEEVEIELEIGLPTDVKHVAHIGLDGSTNPSTSCCNIPDLISLCTLSSTEIEQLAMPEKMDASHLQNMLSKTPYATQN